MGTCDIALYGLGVMGSSLAKNFLRHGYRVALYSKSEAERAAFSDYSENSVLCESEAELLDALAAPRVVFLMITAGGPVDQVIESLLPGLSPGDVVIDGGNSHYRDTNRRAEELAARGIHYLGAGVSGGEEGALYGPSMMVGGSAEGWSICGEMLKRISAQADGEPCCAYLGAGGAGHYVKMVHNGIEYAIIQLIADVYHILRTGLKYSHDKIASLFSRYKRGKLESYLIDITARVLAVKDEDGEPLLDKILDVARQKGTGSWTVLDAVECGVYAPTITEALFMRFFSENTALRKVGADRLHAAVEEMCVRDAETKLEDALLAGMLCAYAQGMELIQKRSLEQGWGIDMVTALALWRGGCIIRSGLLPELIAAAGEQAPNILVSERLSYITSLEGSLREVAAKSVQAGIAVPTLLSTISYYDCCRAGKLPLHVVQALRDCFGAHTYERVDRAGVFHTVWEEESAPAEEIGDYNKDSK